MEQHLGQAHLSGDNDDTLLDILKELPFDLPEQNTNPAQSSMDPVLVPFIGVPFFGATIQTKCPGKESYITEDEYDSPSSARSTCSAFELGSLCGQPNSAGYGAFESNSNRYSPFGLYGASTAQLQGTSSTQAPTHVMQLQADPCAAGAVLGAHQPPAMAAPFGPQPDSMAMLAPAQHWQVRVPASKQEPQLSGYAASKKRTVREPDSESSDDHDDDNDDDDDDYNPFTDSRATAQSRRKTVCVQQPTAKAKRIAAKPAAKPSAKPPAKKERTIQLPGPATSGYKVVTRLKTSGKWEAHHWQWDKQADHKPTERTKWIKRKQHLDAYTSEEAAYHVLEAHMEQQVYLSSPQQ